MPTRTEVKIKLYFPLSLDQIISYCSEPPSASDVKLIALDYAKKLNNFANTINVLIKADWALDIYDDYFEIWMPGVDVKEDLL